MSHVSDVSGMAVNLGIMIGTGWEMKDTMPYKFYDMMSIGW